MSDEPKPNKAELFKKDFTAIYEKFERLRSAAFGIAQNSLASANIEFFPLSSRVKSLNSAVTKVEYKNYENPINDLTDIVGIRVIVYLESDVARANNTLRSVFEIDETNSIDKNAALKANEFGYKSVHLICSLGPTRETLPEYADITSQRFEIQIRTALQHAWAEIEHKRNYKGKGTLPPRLERRLNAAAAALELVDREFSEIARETDDYLIKVSEKAPSVNSDPITFFSMLSLYKTELEKVGLPQSKRNLSDGSSGLLISELANYGINTIADLEKLLASNASREFLKTMPAGNMLGFYRNVMIANDPDLYFRSSYTNDWKAIRFQSLEKISKASQRSDLEALLERHGIETYYDGDGSG